MQLELSKFSKHLKFRKILEKQLFFRKKTMKTLISAQHGNFFRECASKVTVAQQNSKRIKNAFFRKVHGFFIEKKNRKISKLLNVANLLHNAFQMALVLMNCQKDQSLRFLEKWSFLLKKNSEVFYNHET